MDILFDQLLYLCSAIGLKFIIIYNTTIVYGILTI